MTYHHLRIVFFLQQTTTKTYTGISGVTGIVNNHSCFVTLSENPPEHVNNNSAAKFLAHTALRQCQYFDFRGENYSIEYDSVRYCLLSKAVTKFFMALCK